MAMSSKEGGFRSTLNKLEQVLQQMLQPSAKPVEDLKIDRFLDHILLQQSDFMQQLLQEDGGILVNFFNKCCNEIRGQTWVMTFALKLWSTLLSCPSGEVASLLIQTPESVCVPSYAAVIEGQQQGKGLPNVKGQLLGQLFYNLLMAARSTEFWDEASVRNAWLLAVNKFIESCRDHRMTMHILLNKTDAVEVAFECLQDSSLFVVASVQDLVSALLRQLAADHREIAVCDQESAKMSVCVQEQSPSQAKLRKLDSSTMNTTECASVSNPTVKLQDLLQRLAKALQASTLLPAQAQSRLLPNHNESNPTRAINLKLATIGIVRRLWQSSDNDMLSVLDDTLSWLPWCHMTLQEDEEFSKDVRLAVLETLPVVLSKWPWSSSDETSCSTDSKQVKVLRDLFQLPVQVLRWQGIQYSLQLARALYSAQCIMAIKLSPNLMELLECNPSLLAFLTIPLIAILQPSDMPRPRRKLLGFINPHTDASTRLAEVLGEVALQLEEGKVSVVKLVCQCLDSLFEVVEKTPLMLVLQDLHLLEHLALLFEVCWSTEQDATRPNYTSRLKKSPKVTKMALNLLAAILDKIANCKGYFLARCDSSPGPKSAQSILKNISNSLTNTLSVSSNDQALMCKTLDVLTKVFQTRAALDTDDSMLTPTLLDCVLGLVVDTSWEIKDSVLGFLVTVIQYGSDQELIEAKGRRVHLIIWDCVGDYEGFVQASAVCALPIMYKQKTLWEDILLQCKVNEVDVVSTVIHLLRTAGNPFVRSAAIATLTRWLTTHSGIQSSVLQACRVPLDIELAQCNMTSTNCRSTSNGKVDNARKSLPKDVPGVVSGYFQDILEAETKSALQSVGDVEDQPHASTEVVKELRVNSDSHEVSSSGDAPDVINTLPSEHIGKQILSTIYQATNSCDVEMSIKTLNFWGCLCWLHAPQYINLQALFDSGNMSQEVVLSKIAKPAQEGLKSLKHCLDNTKCLRLLLGMMNDSKMAAEKVCCMLQIIQGVYLACGTDSDVTPNMGKNNFDHSGDIGSKQIVHSKGTLDTGIILSCKQDVTEEPQKQLQQEGGTTAQDRAELLAGVAVADEAKVLVDSQSMKDKTDLHHVLCKIPSSLRFEEVFANFLQMDFVAIGQIISNRELDTLDSVLDDLIVPSEEWGLPGDINVDCY